MSYAMSAPLQTAIFERLNGDERLFGKIDGALFDAVPAGLAPDIYVIIGEEDVRDRSDKSAAGAWHDLTISVVSEVTSFRAAKEVAGLIAEVLDGPAPEMTRGRIVGVWFLRARARRVGTGNRRQVDLRYRVQVEDADQVQE